MKVFGIIVGVVTGILGICAMVMPFRTFLGLGWLLGALLLVNGVEMIIAALKQAKKDLWLCLLGLLVVIGGGVLLFSGIQRLLSDVMMAYLIGACILFSGVSQILSAWKRKDLTGGGKALSVISGLLSVILGLLSLAHPFLTMVSAGIMMGAALLVYGVNIVVFACTYGKKKET